MIKRIINNYHFVSEYIESLYKELGKEITIFLKLFEIRVALFATLYRIDINDDNFEMTFEYS